MMPQGVVPTVEGQILGLAHLARHVFTGADPEPLAARLVASAEAGIARGGRPDPAALVDLACLCQLRGDEAQGRGLLSEALETRRLYRTVHGDGSGPHLLALMVAGPLMANTPVDFLLEGSDAVLWQVYLDSDAPPDRLAGDLPDHDAAIMAVAESPENQPVLEAMPGWIADWPRPVLNRDASRVAALGRDGASRMLSGAPGLLVPRTLRLSRRRLAGIAASDDRAAPAASAADSRARAKGKDAGAGTPMPEDAASAGGGTTLPSPPWVVRPVGSQAGQGMALVERRADLAAAIAAAPAPAYYLAPYLALRGDDGLFPKMRVAMVGGRPHPVHLALSDHWIVHYLSAGMAADPARRGREAAWMDGFERDFLCRHGAALAALHERIGLDYYGIDCAEAPDGRLAIFEVDIAMIVHDMDDAAVFPYKTVAMRRLFGAFLGLIAPPGRAGQS